MCVIPFSDEKDVIKRANNTKYGLSGGKNSQFFPSFIEGVIDFFFHRRFYQ